MFEDLINNYWDKFRNLVVKVKEPEIPEYEKGILQIYEERAERFNCGGKYNYTAKSLFTEVCEDISLRILEEDYVLKYIVMREETYQLYHYYENNCPPNLCPSFDICDKTKKYPIACVSSREWRWWVEEMGY